MHPVVQHAHAEEQRAGDKPVRHHLHHAALNTHGRAAQAAGVAVDTEHDEETQGDETHVGN